MHILVEVVAKNFFLLIVDRYRLDLAPMHFSFLTKLLELPVKRVVRSLRKSDLERPLQLASSFSSASWKGTRPPWPPEATGIV